MKNVQVKLLENLIKTPSPSGFEDKIAEFIKKELLQYLPQTHVKIDNNKNVIAIIKGTSDKKIMIDAHSDEIGFIISNIDKEGLISVQYIGGGDFSILSARELVILNEKRNVNAVVNRKHSHLVYDENDTFITNLKDAVVDIGVRKKNRVASIIKIGDPVVYKPSFNQLRESYFSGHGFDDKAGCYVLIEAIKEIVKLKKKPVPTLIFTFSTQEEIGGDKCKPLIKRYKPDLFMEIDVTFASDCGTDENMEKEVGFCELNKGMVIYRGVGIDKDYLKLLETTARNNKIKVQYQASTGDTGYTSSYVSSEENGVRILNFSIPLRNMHTPTEIINLNDLNNGANLISKFLFRKNIIRPLEN